jgi:RNA exonuclease 4
VCCIDRCCRVLFIPRQCQAEVAKILKGKILVGHALKNDLSVLLLSHPRNKIRDTSRYKPLMRPHGRKQGKFRPRALRDLTIQHFKVDIQAGEHDSVSMTRPSSVQYLTDLLL